jgi:hypothetical protein
MLSKESFESYSQVLSDFSITFLPSSVIAVCVLLFVIVLSWFVLDFVGVGLTFCANKLFDTNKQIPKTINNTLHIKKTNFRF